jgi:hypothetical protein
VKSACSIRLAWSLIGFLFALRIFMLPGCNFLFSNYLLSEAFGYSLLHTAWSRVLLEKLTGFQPVKKFPAFHLTRRFITAFTSARDLSLFWASSIQSIPPHPTSWRSILLLYSHLRLGLPSGLFPQVFPQKPCIRLSSTHTCYMPRPSHSFRFCPPKNIGWGVQIIQFLIV